MWKLRFEPVFFTVLIPCLVILWIGSFPKESESVPQPHSSYGQQQGSMNMNQWYSLFRDAAKYLDKDQQPRRSRVDPNIRYFVEPTSSGLVKLRAIRSGFIGDMANAYRLYRLQEIENEFGTKARPRFGKRAEVAEGNFLPVYYGLGEGYGNTKGTDQDDDNDEQNDDKNQTGGLSPTERGRRRR